MGNIGRIAVLIGLILAVLGGFGISADWFPWVMAVLGIIVGLLNVQAVETRGFLIAMIALMLSFTALHSLPLIGDRFTLIMGHSMAFLAPATLIVALRSILTHLAD